MYIVQAVLIIYRFNMKTNSCKPTFHRINPPSDNLKRNTLVYGNLNALVVRPQTPFCHQILTKHNVDLRREHLYISFAPDTSTGAYANMEMGGGGREN